jgi:prevent-host-death family protein
MAVGIREAKARFSHYLEVARHTGDVVITDRGRPVARLVAIEGRARTGEEALEELVASGVIERGVDRRRRTRFQPVTPLREASISALVRAMRRR